MSAPPEIVCFGDSITAGQGLDDPSTQAFPAQLARITGKTVAAKGVCGDTTRIALERFPRDVQESGARTVIIQFGHNDCNAWASDKGHPRVSLRAFIANLQEMKLRASLHHIRALFLGPHPTEKGNVYEHTRNEYLLRMPDPLIELSALTLLDDIHPDEDGHLHIARCLRFAL